MPVSKWIQEEEGGGGRPSLICFWEERNKDTTKYTTFYYALPLVILFFSPAPYGMAAWQTPFIVCVGQGLWPQLAVPAQRRRRDLEGGFSGVTMCLMSWPCPVTPFHASFPDSPPGWPEGLPQPCAPPWLAATRLCCVCAWLEEGLAPT